MAVLGVPGVPGATTGAPCGVLPLELGSGRSKGGMVFLRGD